MADLKPSANVPHSKHRRTVVLDDELAKQVNQNMSKAEEADAFRFSSDRKKWDSVFEHYNTRHPILGNIGRDAQQIVLTSFAELSEPMREQLEYLEEPKGLVATDCYERVCLDLSTSHGITGSIPMCVSSLSYYSYPLEQTRYF